MDGEDQEGEIWKAVPGWEHYEVSSLGRLRRYCMRGKSPSRRMRFVRGSRTAQGYLRATLWAQGGDSKDCTIHTLVLLAFRGAPIAGQVARHLDGTRTNNVLENLAWGTAKENSSDKYVHGTQPYGSKVGTAKLTELKVRAGLAMAAQRVPVRLVAGVLGVTRSCWINALLGRTWPKVNRAGIPDLPLKYQALRC